MITKRFSIALFHQEEEELLVHGGNPFPMVYLCFVVVVQIVVVSAVPSVDGAGLGVSLSVCGLKTSNTRSTLPLVAADTRGHRCLL